MDYPDITLKAEISAGSAISDSCEQLTELATRLGCYVEADFNGTTLMAGPGGIPAEMVKQYDRVRNSNGPKLAFNH